MSFSLTYQGSKTEKQTLVHEGLELNSDECKELKSLLSGRSFTLKEENIGFSLTTESGGFSYEKHDLAIGRHPIPNGHDFIVDGIHFTPVVLVDRAEVSKSSKTKSLISRALIGLILLFELIVVFILPSSLSESSTFQRELLLEHASTELDELRASLRVSHKNQVSLSAIRQAIIKQVRDELSAMANDIRNNPGDISIEQLEDIKESLSVCRKLIPRLKYGSFVDQVPGLDRQLIIDRLFVEE